MMPIIPSLRINLQCSSRPSTAAISPCRKASSCTQELHVSVTSTIFVLPSCSCTLVGKVSRSMLYVLIFSPIWPAAAVKLVVRKLSNDSAWIKCTCCNLRWVGPIATRERCWTVLLGWESHTAPSTVTNCIHFWFCLLKEWDVLQLTAHAMAPSNSRLFYVTLFLSKHLTNTFAVMNAPNGLTKERGNWYHLDLLGKLHRLILDRIGHN